MKNLVKILMTLMVISTAINSASAKVLFSEKVGGTNGINFMLPAERFDILSTESITRIAIQHGRRIEQIEIEYANGENVSQIESVGNDAGEWSFIELEEGEYIIYITGRAGTLIDQLTFYTSMRRTFGPYGGSGGQDFEISIPSNAKVIGFTGNAGPSINQIGLIYKTPDTENESAENSGRVVRDHRTKNPGTTGIKTAPIPTVRNTRDHRTGAGEASHFDSIGVMNYTQFNKKMVISPIFEMNGRGNQEQEAKQTTTSTAKRTSDNAYDIGNSNWHPDSISVMNYTLFNKNVVRKPFVQMNGRGNQEPEVKGTETTNKVNIRDHRKNN